MTDSKELIDEKAAALATIQKCADALLNASLDVTAWDNLPPMVGTMAMMILEEVKKCQG